MKKFYFVVVGASRSGTTSLWHYLRQHPDIYVPKKKELNFFNVNEFYEQGISFYENMFSGWKDQKVIGDISPLYLTTGLLYRKFRQDAYFSEKDSAVRRIRSLLPNVRIVLTLRNPVYRFYSQYKKNYYQGKDSVLRNIENHLERDLSFSGPPQSNFIFANQYSSHLKHVRNFILKDNIYLMIFEEWIKDTKSALEKLFVFLDVNPKVTIDTTKIMNQGIIYRNIACNNKSITWNNDFSPVSPLSNNLKKRLFTIFADDIDAVECIVGRRLPEWHK